jgi:dTDP-4-amino-4,6-dideoxygalactose transaminase
MTPVRERSASPETPDAAGAAGPVPFAPPSIEDADVTAVADVLRSGWLTSGARAREFETAFAAYAAAPHALALNSCTAALHLALLAAGVGPGDEVITTPLTFCATANTIVHTGATPVFADVDPDTLNIDPAAVAAAVTPRTKALLPVHYGGRPVDVLALRAVASRHGLVTIEDAAHAVEAVSNAGKVGGTADYTCFSFYATKNLTTGEGGMLTALSGERAAWARMASLHGLSRDAWMRYAPGGRAEYDVAMAGFKYNMPDIQAALGLSQLRRLERLLARREAIWRRYEAGLRDLPLALPAAPAVGTRHARHLFSVGVDEAACGASRDALAAALSRLGISTSVHFKAVHLLSFYAGRGMSGPGRFPHAERASRTRLSLPLSAALGDAQIDRVIDAVRHCLTGAAA